MKFQFKKEWLLKYKFWLMLAVIPPAACAALFILDSVVGSEIESKRKPILDAAKKYKQPMSGPQYSQPGIDLLKKEAERVKKEEVSVWEKAYKDQEPLFRLPARFEAECNFEKGLFAEDIKVYTDKVVTEVMADKKLKELPADQPNVVHGKVVDITKESVTIQDRKKNKIRFTRTPTVKVRDAKVADPAKSNIYWIRMKLNDVLTVFYQNGKYFGDPSSKLEQEAFAKYYRTQLPAVIDQLDPLNPVKGEGVVQFGDWTYDKLVQLREWAKGEEEEGAPTPGKAFRFLPRFKTDKDASDDIWIAQEDLWIQSELFRLIRMANDYVSKFDVDKKAENNMEVTVHNSYWEINLKLADNKLKGTFTNLLPRRQKLDFKLKVQMSSAKTAEPEVIELKQGLPLLPHGTKGGGDSRTVDIDLKGRQPRNGIFKVEQVLTWETAAVRRVDGIYIGKMDNVNANGHRTFPDPLVGYPNRGAPTVAAAAIPPAPGTQPGKGDPAKDNKAMIGKGGKTYNNQDRERYTEIAEQLRRLPVAVVLIVEQGQVDRVQTAFNNSRFRFLTTQVLLNHYPGSVRPPAVEAIPVAATDVKGLPMPMVGVLKQPPPVRVARGPSGSSDEMEANVEMVIYGIITIYEKLPVRAKNPNPS